MVFKAKEIPRPISVPIPITINNIIDSYVEDSNSTNENQDQEHQSVSPILIKKSTKTITSLQFEEPIIMSSSSKKTNIATNINKNNKTNSTLSSISNIITSLSEKIPKNKRTSAEELPRRTTTGLQKKVTPSSTTWSKNACTSSLSIPCHSESERPSSISQDGLIISPKQIGSGRGRKLIDIKTSSTKPSEVKKLSARNLVKSPCPSPSKTLDNKPKKKVSSPIPTPTPSKKMVKKHLASPPQLVVTAAPDSPNFQEFSLDSKYFYPERPSSSLSFQHYELTKLMESFINSATEPWNNSKLFSTPRRHSCSVCVDIEKHSDSEKILTSSISDAEYNLRCTDFGISDYLSTKVDYEKENEADVMNLSSSEESIDSFLAASPPHRFSDPDLESIEPLAVTLGTILKLEESENTKEVKEPESQVVDANECKKFIQNQKRPQIQTNPRKPFRRQVSLPITPACPLPKKSKSTHSLNRIQSFNLRSKNCYSDEMGNQRILESGRSFDSTGSFSNGDEGSDDNIPNTPNPVKISNDATIRRCFSITSSWEEGMGVNEDCSSDSLDLYFTESLEQGDAATSPSPFSITYSTRDNGDGLFISELERNAYVVRNNRMKQLRRQDTVGNIAPPDYCI